ncbi:MAG: hypothetical protein JO250_20650 [Armatimonadetes bacterium]|nr:hypothetical protein [Armatimonadota bacterium]
MNAVAGGTSSFLIYNPQPTQCGQGDYVRYAGEGPQLYWNITADLRLGGAFVTVRPPSDAQLGQYGIWVDVNDNQGGCQVYSIDLEVSGGTSLPPPPGPGSSC